MDEKELLLSNIEDISKWVLFPDFERVEWINEIIKQFWPKISHMVVKLVKDFEPSIQQNQMLRNFKFEKLNFGKIVSISRKWNLRILIISLFYRHHA